MKFPSLFKIQENFSFSLLSCPSTPCGNLKTLSFRDENNHNIFNSESVDDNNVDDLIVEEMIEGLKNEKERFFFEAGEKNNSILEGSKSKRFFFEAREKNNSILESSKSKRFFFEAREKNNSILEGSKSNNSSSNELDFLSFNDSCVITTAMDSMDPVGDFKKSIEEMVEAYQEIKDCDKCFEELLIWYLKVNEEKNHRYIIDAFFDLLNSYPSTSTPTTTNTSCYSHSFTNSSFSFCSPSCSTTSPPSLWSLLKVDDDHEIKPADDTPSVIS